MAVQFLKHVALAIPEADCDKAEEFYTNFGLELRRRGDLMAFACKGSRYDAVILVPGANRKQLHHVAMGTDEGGLAWIKQRLALEEIPLLDAPECIDAHEISENRIWFRDPHGVLFQVAVCPPEKAPAPEPQFLINSPGHFNRVDVGALPPKSDIADVCPRKLGHALLFTPSISGSIRFLTDVLGMRLSDRSEDAVAFLHCQGGSDHHVLALGSSHDIGFHHASFMVGSPDDVGVGGQRMVDKGYGPSWGFGRHAIGSNFFHYIRDPWGSYAEYYADIDYIANSDTWEAQNWPIEDSLHTWGPNPPEDFVHNYEAG
ncbi:hypothetical protein G8770_12515 [Aestuariicella hydrocarbonica]|uniref:VOC domain-containing protein n=1 Tax=Pseudomaricurvus hydrocarbonicus TaxID=1470433 RepID=A0A9E5JT73_9GAMM|nr:VOC family protein [Aestuariicella hydrocarbonica]NHO66363.1 hypothetical protein [Aestuariicella hydrocarbonica]